MFYSFPEQGQTIDFTYVQISVIKRNESFINVPTGFRNCSDVWYFCLFFFFAVVVFQFIVNQASFIISKG